MRPTPLILINPQSVFSQPGNPRSCYIADTQNNTIRKITAAGIVTTLAGSAGEAGSTDGIGASARFNFPMGIAVDGSGNIYVSDANSATIRRIDGHGVKLTENDNWTPGLATTFAAVGAFALPASSRDAALLTVMEPGSYTVQVRGADGGTGEELIEIYEVP